MAKTKVSEWDSTPGNNTDIDSINIAEGCAPSGINNAIRELMSQVKDFQQGTYSDPFNGPVNGTIGATTPAAGAFTTLTASSTATLNTLASSGATLTGGSINNMAIGGSTAAAGAFTTLAASGAVTLSGGTANGVAYLNGSKVLTTGSALTFDGTNLGIGATTPLQLLHLSSASPPGMQLTYQGVGASRIGIAAGNALTFGLDTSNGATEQMRLTSTGLGIGTSSPANKLVVNVGSAATNGLYIYGTGGSVPTIYLGHDASHGTDATIASNGSTGNLEIAPRSGYDTYIKNGNLGLGVTPSAWSLGKALQIGTSGAASLLGYNNSFYLTANAYYDGSWKYTATAAAGRYQLESGVHSWSIAPSGTAGNAISFTQAMTLTAAGRLGIGITSPAANLDVSSTARLGSFDINVSTADSAVWINGSDFGIGTYYGNAFKFLTNNTERARIDSSGNLLIGTTTGIYGVRTVISATGVSAAVLTTDTSAEYGPIVWNKGTSGNNGFVLFQTEASATSRGSITYNRGSGVVAYNTTSDYRAKDIIGPIADSGAVIDSVPVYIGKMKGATQERPMFIAHETPAYAHTGEKDAVDADGNPVYQQMDASTLVPVMWAEIQSLRKRIAALEAK